jgi:small subunit ribosomal protein S6
MSDIPPRLYEGLFLINQTAVGGSLSNALEAVNNMLARADASIRTLHKWDERKLAYTIDSQKRGVYLISLFDVDPVQIPNIERDCNLSDEVTRVLITKAEHYGDTEIDALIEAGKDSNVQAIVQEPGDDTGETPAQPAEPADDHEAEADTDDQDDDSDD